MPPVIQIYSSVTHEHLAHELGHWYYMHPTKLLLISQLHLFTILALFPAFMHAPPFLRAFDFPEHVAAQPPVIIAFLLFQVGSQSLPSKSSAFRLFHKLVHVC